MIAPIRTIIHAFFLVTVLACPAMAQFEPLGADTRWLTVRGEGAIRTRPDVATILLGVVSNADTAKAALAANSEAMRRILDYLRAGGVDSRDLQTSEFSVESILRSDRFVPEQDRDPTPKIVGYKVQNTIRLRIRDLPSMGSVLDQVVTLGANLISRPVFGVANREALEDSAREAAVRDARRKAELYARAADIRLGSVARLLDTGSGGGADLPIQTAENSGSDPAPIEGGEIIVRAGVSITWTLQ